MRRMIIKLISVLTLIAALLPLALGEGEYYNIRELAKITPQRWQQSYEAYGRKIEIDTEITLPDVDKVPMLRVKQTPPLQDAEIKHWLKELKLKKNESRRWDKSGKYSYYFGTNEDRSCVTFHLPAINEKYGETMETIANPETGLLEYELDKAYAPRNTLTIREAFEITKARAETLMGREIDMEIDTVALQGYYERKTGKPIREKDGYLLRCIPKMEGIPCLDRTITGYGKDCIYGRVYSADSYNVSCSLLDKEKVLIEDLPLCSFENAKKAFESLIENGRIRKIYKLQLAYGKYYDKEQGFVMLPVWNAWCELYPSGKDEMMDMDKESKTYYHMLSYHRVIVNAQNAAIIYIGAGSAQATWWAEGLGEKSGVPAALQWKDVQ